jgi:DNA (cytosine-5)-methyltransferase 1
MQKLPAHRNIMLPTPRVQMTRPTSPRSDIKGGHKGNLEEVVALMEGLNGGSLNPTWVEWLMGWPLGWTDLAPLETDRFRQWFDSHGRS